MTAATIREQISQPFVGNIVELYHIDLNPIGVAEEFWFTPSSSVAISFNGQAYTPFPISVTGSDRDLNAAPGRVTLNVSNVTQQLAALVISYGDMVGGHVTYIRTFENFLDGKPNGGSNQSFPVQRYIIQQKSAFNQQTISFVLSTELDRANLMLPRRQCLKSQAGTAILWCPGMQRTK